MAGGLFVEQMIWRKAEDVRRIGILSCGGAVVECSPTQLKVQGSIPGNGGQILTSCRDSNKGN